MHLLTTMASCVLFFGLGYWTYRHSESIYRVFQRIGGRNFYPREGRGRDRLIRFYRMLGLFWMGVAVLGAIYLSISTLLP